MPVFDLNIRVQEIVSIGTLVEFYRSTGDGAPRVAAFVLRVRRTETDHRVVKRALHFLIGRQIQLDLVSVSIEVYIFKLLMR